MAGDSGRVRRAWALGLAAALIAAPGCTLFSDKFAPDPPTGEVDIPLAQTDLHQPFSGLQSVLAPYQDLLSGLPASWEAVPLGDSGLGFICDLLFSSQ